MVQLRVLSCSWVLCKIFNIAALNAVLSELKVLMCSAVKALFHKLFGGVGGGRYFSQDSQLTAKFELGMFQGICCTQHSK
jgi:hypothetical protein